MSVALTRSLVALLLAVPLALVGGTAQATACSGTSGVSVVVQFPDGHTETGCAAGDPTSGLDALSRAGFAYTFPANNQNPGFVCTLKGAPSDAKCLDPSYWAYFHAPRGGSWTYSTLGAGSFDPRPGTVEGWRFERVDAGKVGPSTKPPSNPKAAPAPATGSGGSSGGSGGSGSASSGSTGSVAAPTPSANASPSAVSSTQASAVAEALKSAKAVAKASAEASASASAGASASATPNDVTSPVSASVAQSASATDDGSDGSGGGLPWWAGVLAVVLLGGAAGGVTLARRRA